LRASKNSKKGFDAGEKGKRQRPDSPNLNDVIKGRVSGGGAKEERSENRAGIG